MFLWCPWLSCWDSSHELREFERQSRYYIHIQIISVVKKLWTSSTYPSYELKSIPVGFLAFNIPIIFICLFVCFGFLWHINLCGLFNAKIHFYANSTWCFQKSFQTFLYRHCHSWWISKMQSGREDTLEETICNKSLFLNLEKIPQKRMECFRVLFDHFAWIEYQFFQWHKRFKEGRESMRDDQMCWRE